MYKAQYFTHVLYCIVTNPRGRYHLCVHLQMGKQKQRREWRSPSEFVTEPRTWTHVLHSILWTFFFVKLSESKLISKFCFSKSPTTLWKGVGDCDILLLNVDRGMKLQGLRQWLVTVSLHSLYLTWSSQQPGQVCLPSLFLFNKKIKAQRVE